MIGSNTCLGKPGVWEDYPYIGSFDFREAGVAISLCILNYSLAIS